jgi:enoyl-CoA hydratase/carnithine racemase
MTPGRPFGWEVHDGIATLTFDRPDVLNALTFDIYAELADLFAGLRTIDDVRCVVLTGRGRAFCSGGDVHEIIGELIERDMKAHLDFARMTGLVVRNMRQLEKPIIAALNGTTAGAGAVLALAADLRIAADSATFSFLFTKVGLTGADMGAAYLLPRIVGLGRASEILLFGDRISAAECERIGLVNRVVPPERLLPTATEWARRLADGPSLALGVTKTMLQNELHMDLVAALESEAQAQALLLMGEDHRRFYEAFREKRAPRFGGR